MRATIATLRSVAVRVLIASSLGLAVVGAAALPASAHPADAYTVTIAGPAEHPLVNTTWNITGSVSPAAPGASVQLQQLVAGQFEGVAVAKLDANSAYTFPRDIPSAGAITYRVLKPWGNGYLRGYSPELRVWITGDTIDTGRPIRATDDLISASGMYRLTMRPNGNLELDVVENGRYVWSSRTGGHPGAWAMLQRDGDLVVYDTDGTVLMHTDSGGHADGTYSLTVQGDGNVVIFTPGGSPLWSSHTTNDTLLPNETLAPGQYISSADGRYQAIMQTDGTLVVYDNQNKTTLWDSYTAVSDSLVTMQTDGNLMLRGPYGRPMWSSRTPGNDGAYAVIQDDGNFMVYIGQTPIWGSDGINGILGDDYPTTLRNATKDTVIDPWRFYNRECVSFVAWRLNHANHFDLSNYMDGGHFGNANNWDDNARKLGYTVNNTPVRGAVAQTDKSTYGHVAWVAAVGNSTVTIEDYNYSAPGSYGERTVPKSDYVYIHFKDL